MAKNWSTRTVVWEVNVCRRALEFPPGFIISQRHFKRSVEQSKPNPGPAVRLSDFSQSFTPSSLPDAFVGARSILWTAFAFHAASSWSSHVGFLVNCWFLWTCCFRSPYVIRSKVVCLLESNFVLNWTYADVSFICMPYKPRLSFIFSMEDLAMDTYCFMQQLRPYICDIKGKWQVS